MQANVVETEVVDIEALKKGVNGGQAQTLVSGQRGILMQQTMINFVKAPDSSIRLRGSKFNHCSLYFSDSNRATTNAIVQPDFKFEDLGIGGLDSEFSSIFRRAFASRIFPPSLVQKLGIQHVKGALSITLLFY